LDAEDQELDLVEGSTPSKTEKETVGRAEAGNVEAPTPNDAERQRKKESNNVEGTDRSLSVRRSGRAHIRKERWQWLENDHRNPKKKKKQEETPGPKEKTLQAQPAEEKER
jgi:hypothetical protein